MKLGVSRIALKFSVIVSLIIITVMWIMATLIMQQTRQSLIKEMEIRAEFFARSVREALFPQPDDFQLYFNVQEMVKEQAVTYAMVLDSKGQVISHSEKEKIGQFDVSEEGKRAAGTRQTIIQPFLLKNEQLFDIAVPIMVGNNFKAGTVRIGFSQKSITAALVEKRKKIIYITGALLGLGIFITIIMVTWMVRPVNKLASAAQQIGTGNLEVQVTIRTHDELQDLAHSFNDMVKGLKDLDRVRNTFGRYVTKQVAEAILDGRLQLEGERKKATILLSDIRGFTSISEKIEPEEVVDFLNRYFNIMVEVVVKYEGRLDKFIGDAILAVFGDAMPHEDDARRAVLTALEMREKLDEYNQERQHEGKEPLRIGIAVHTGEVVAGEIGSKHKTEYTVIGDTVNLTSRMESLNKEFKTDILISESTYLEVKDLVEVQELSEVPIRGKEKPLNLYALKGKKNKSSRE
ncbi:MAG: HAMP domain-containing protein [Elusimicrobia bacterium]|nr:HAMP domain-containing protein [Elusimicrobiota bacterium]